MNRSETGQFFTRLSNLASNYVSRRNRAYTKEPRFFTKTEACNYLNEIDVRTLRKYTEQLGIDCTRHEDAAWLISIEELYQVRDHLPQSLRPEPKFQRQEDQKLQVIVVQNQKGGVGKTTYAATCASGLATEYHQQYRVGMIDLDPQHTLTSLYVSDQTRGDYLSVGDLLLDKFELDDGETLQQLHSECFLETTIPNLRILPASQEDRSVEGMFHQKMFAGQLANPYQRLNNIIKSVEDEFDIIIIDTPPATNFATLNAYFAATGVIAPIQLSENDIDASCAWFKFIPEVWQLLEGLDHKGYDFFKIQITNFIESDTSLQLLERFDSVFRDVCYRNEFRHSEAIKVCTKHLSTVFDMSKSEFPKTKRTFERAALNARSVIAVLHQDITNVWSKKNS